ncbi:MAG: GTP-binding protein [Eubacteriales bacterium]|nr:GTP-binding protein [Eubacteriales bacterium]
MTKVDIISGFLGAGKTTLIKKLLKDSLAGEQVVLIENEFGEIGIDGGFLKEAGIEIREMNSGCICCSLVGDFGVALKEVIDKYHPDRIIIEPSGVGKLSDVTKAVLSVEKEADITINSLTTVVDVKKCKMYLRNFGEFFENQVENASTIILSRTDVADDKKIYEAIELLKEKMKEDATLVTTPIEKLSGAKLLEAMEKTVSLADELMNEEVCPVCGGHHEHHHEHEHHHDHDECGCEHEHHHEHHHDHDECGCGHDHHHHHADEVFTSWGCETAKTFTKEQIENILDTLSESEEYGVILRSKGMVEGADGQWIYFDMVPGEDDVRNGEPDYTGRICVIGSKLQEQKLAKLFGVNA